MSSQMSAASSSDFRGFLDGLRHGPWHVGVTSGQESVDSVGERSGIVSAEEFDGSGSDFRGLVLEGSLSAGKGDGVGGHVGTASGSYFSGFLDWLRHGPWHVSITSWQVSVDSVGERSGIVSAVEFDGSGSDFRCLVLEGSLSAAGGGVGGFMGTTGGSYFGGFLCWWRECGVREVQVRIVVKSGGKLSRRNTGQSKDKGENLCNIEVIYN